MNSGIDLHQSFLPEDDCDGTLIPLADRNRNSRAQNERVANHMKGRCLLRDTNPLVSALPISLIVLSGCTIPMQLNFQNAVSTEFLDGNYQRLASCSYQRLGGHQAQLTKTDLPQRGRTVIASTVGSDKRWELAFIDEDGGKQTRLEVTTASEPSPSEHILALVRACAA